MKEKLSKFLRPRLAVLLAAALLAAYLPAMPAVRAAGVAPTSAWEEQDGVRDEHFVENPTTLDSYTYSKSDGTTETVTVDHDAPLGSKKNPISIPDEKALIRFGKQTQNFEDTRGKYYILDKQDGVYDMGAHTMLPLMGDATSASGMPSPKAPFLGVLIGNGARIENVCINTTQTAFGLFGIIGWYGREGVEVTDLTVSLTSTSSEKSSIITAGGLVGYVRGGVTLTNCTANVTGDLGGQYAGGLVGYAFEGPTLTNCTANVTGNVTGNLTAEGKDSNAGGLVGYVKWDDVALTNCTAEVSGSLTADEYGNAGGLVGGVDGGNAALTDCAAEVAGSLTAGNDGYAGGLVGGVDSSTVTLEDCTATVGNLTAAGEYGLAGGLVGDVHDGTATLTDCTAEVAGSLTAGYAGGLVGIGDNMTLTNCTATVTGNLTAGEYGVAGGLVGYVDSSEAAALTHCTATVGSLTAAGEDGAVGGLVGYVASMGTVTLTDCSAQAVITENSPSRPVGAGTATFSGANVTTLRMGAGSSVSLALVNNTALTLADSSGVLTATGEASGNETTGSVEVTSNGGAEIQVHGGSDSGGRTYTLTGVNGTLRLEDKTPTEYWVTADASFGTSDADPLAKGDKVDLLGEAGNRLCTVSVKAGTGGRASVSNDGPVSAGTEVTVKAIPDSGYRFVGWTEDGQQVSTEASYAFEVTASRTLTAVFEVIKPRYTVTVQAETGGSVSSGGTFDAGTTVTVKATPESGYRFVNWTEDGQTVSAEASYTFTVTSSCTLTAAFERTSTGGSSGGGGTYTPPPKKDEPQTGSSGGWKDIQKELENTKPGDNVDVAMNGATEVPKEVLEGIAGKDVEVSFDMGGGIVWTVSGKDIPAGIGSLNLGIRTGSSSIPVSVFNTITGEKSTIQFTLAHSGPFGTVLHLSLNLGAANRGYWANLYWFDEGGKELVFQHSCRIDEEGTASWPFDHASSYAVVIDEKNHDPAWENPFTDISEGDWYYEAVRFVHEQGLMNGYSDGRFGPNDTLSRAQLAQILFNKEGRPVVNYLMQFDDVAGEAWYTEAVRWAASQGIVGGYGNGTFGPNDPITREQLAVMLWRYSGSPAATSKELYFNDTDEISGFALEALRWAVENGILNGYGDGRLGPQGQATRAQVAQMLKNFIENQEEENT